MKSITAPASEWLSAAQIARLELPGVPRSKRAVHALAMAEKWASRIAEDGSPLARPRRARGGGLEYHVDLLPDVARQLVVAEVEASAEAHGTAASPFGSDPMADAWHWFARQPASVKLKARQRLLILNFVERCIENGAAKSIAISIVAEGHKMSPRAIADWFAWTAGVEPRHRLPFLASGMPGRGKVQKTAAQIAERRRIAVDKARAALKRLHPDDRRDLLMDVISLELKS